MIRHGFSGLHRPDLRHWYSFSGVSLNVVQLVQSTPAFCRHLDNLRRDWQNDTLIHFDAKWDNCIVLGRSADTYSGRVRLIDWELSGLGDGCWDVGSLLADYLNLWRSSRPLLDERTSEDNRAGYRLERMQPAIRAFCKNYARCMQYEHHEANAFLIKTAQFAAVRLLQIAVERAQISSELTNNIVGELQLSLNILQRPAAAIAHLFGIRFSGFGS